MYLCLYVQCTFNAYTLYIICTYTSMNKYIQTTKFGSKMIAKLFNKFLFAKIFP